MALINDFLLTLLLLSPLLHWNDLHFKWLL